MKQKSPLFLLPYSSDWLKFFLAVHNLFLCVSYQKCLRFPLSSKEAFLHTWFQKIASQLLNCFAVPICFMEKAQVCSCSLYSTVRRTNFETWWDVRSRENWGCGGGNLGDGCQEFSPIVVFSQRRNGALSLMENIQEELPLGKNSHQQDLESAIQVKQWGLKLSQIFWDPSEL